MKNKIFIFFLFAFINSPFLANTQTEKLSQQEIKSFILTETKEGGKLDFFTAIKGKEYNGAQVMKGIFMSNIEIALYKWGKANFELGVENIETALNIFQEFKGKELDMREKEIIPMGYRNDLKNKSKE